jgi:ribosomal protein L31
MHRRLYQTHAHPQLFRQVIQLTDGSMIRVVSVTKDRPFVKTGVDSLSHPAWNPQLRSKMMLSEHGEVAKFKERFTGMGEEELNDFGGMLPAGKATMVPVKSANKSTNKNTKSKKK